MEYKFMIIILVFCAIINCQNISIVFVPQQTTITVTLTSFVNQACVTPSASILQITSNISSGILPTFVTGAAERKFISPTGAAGAGAIAVVGFLFL
ncbi:hypothetical protein DASC09_062680 [Saccharomycopsis crataegensis]|uniref:Uncharacterized protein n=1 Tax=Saccharomycopsis crataegensis TaxID=43959 RepID=A0AAV5QVU9_9ASCO|nr:hypothetical protein DASC09_062680 [Saccharomycopsis crataegensis]